MKQAENQLQMLGPEASLAFFSKLDKANECKPTKPFVGRKRDKRKNPCICDCGPDSDCCGFN